jgi:hypothetical protein
LTFEQKSLSKKNHTTIDNFQCFFTKKMKKNQEISKLFRNLISKLG